MQQKFPLVSVWLKYHNPKVCWLYLIPLVCRSVRLNSFKRVAGHESLRSQQLAINNIHKQRYLLRYTYLLLEAPRGQATRYLSCFELHSLIGVYLFFWVLPVKQTALIALLPCRLN